MFEYVLVFLLILIIWNLLKKPTQYPPGPWGIPLIGYFPFGLKAFHERIKELQAKHYPIFSWRFGSKFLVFICDFKLAKEVLNNQAFADRPSFSFIKVFDGEINMGITTSNGLTWHNIRRFTLRHMKDLGMGKSKIVSSIQREANELVEVMKKQSGTVAPVPHEMSTAIVNILWQMVAGKRHDLNDAEIISLDKDMNEFQENLGHLMVRDFFPWVDYVLPESLLNYISKRDMYRKLTKRIEMRFKKDIEEHIATLDENNPRDFIDEYLIEMEKQKDDPDSTMSERDLLGAIADMFAAGLATTSITLHWSVFYLAKYPDIQKDLQDQIDSVLPNGLSPTLEHRSRLPKVEAFFTEILRHSSLGEFGLPRTTPKDIKFAGHVIPKGAIVFPCEKYIHYDKKVYNSPEIFNPKRFLDSEGKFVNPKEGFIAFGMGKRQCIGESLARMEIFIFLVTMLQHVSFHPPPNKDVIMDNINILVFNIPHLKQDILIKSRF
ncbi:Cytochrome P450 2L1 [Armadillidium nasatum]|uniref:Cytochrome P450 2L1 n=1 Tax=Armadillidium nasatum TaxID=96803 RepID=A0A5N5TN11_9CRUS|nr:Cytochrome P450 2L1 [Armadillidium nasatum]